MAHVSVSAKTYSFTNGTANDATPVDASFTSLFNNDSALATAVTQLEDGLFPETTSITLNSNFASTPSSNLSLIAERGSSTNTVIRWNETSDQWEFTNDGSTYFIIPTAATLQDMNNTAAPVYATAATFTVAKINCTNSALSGYIRKNSSTTVDISTFGLNGVAQSSTLTGTISTSGSSTTITGVGTSFTTDFQVGDVIYPNVTGASGARRITAIGGNTTLTVESAVTLSSQAFKRGGEAPSTWYNLYAITDGTTPGLILSTRNVAAGDTLADLPSGYSSSRQLSFAVRNNSSSNLLPFGVGAGWPRRPYIQYNVSLSDLEGSTVGTTNIVNTNTSTAFTSTLTTASSTYIPPISRMARFQLLMNYTALASLKIRPTGSGLTNGVSIRASSSHARPQVQTDLETNSSQQIDYSLSASTTDAYVDVVGFYVTEVN